MLKLLLTAAAFSAIAGCAIQPRSPALAGYDAEYLPYSSAEAVSAVVFRRTGANGSIPQCVAENVSNNGETLTDSSNSFVGSYTGNYYHAEKSVQTSGGSVLQYVSDDSASVVAAGTTRYDVNALVSRSVRFKLSVRQRENERLYRFSDLQQAQLNSGVVANNGYNPIGSWSGANPDYALASLQKIVNSIEACLE